MGELMARFLTPIGAALSIVLLACTTAGDDDRAVRLEDLPLERLIVQDRDSGARSAVNAFAEFEEELPFEPVYPSELPEGFQLDSAIAYAVPGNFDPFGVRLALRWVDDGGSKLDIEQGRREYGKGGEPIALGDDVVGYLVSGQESVMTWRACDLGFWLLADSTLRSEDVVSIARLTLACGH